MHGTGAWRVAHVAGTAGRLERLAEMLRHLRVATPVALGKPHDALDAGLGLTGVALEEIVDDGAGPGVEWKELDAHGAAGVVAAPHDAGLLEHADEHARIVVAGGDLPGIDDAAEVADGAVDGAEIVRPGDVRDGESPHCGGIGGAREQQRLARRAVPAATPHHLHVALERVRVVEEADEANVGLVDSHPEGRRGHDTTNPAGDEVVLDARALVGLEAGVVVLQPEPVPPQCPRDALAGVARTGVHDRAPVAGGPSSV